MTKSMMGVHDPDILYQEVSNPPPEGSQRVYIYRPPVLTGAAGVPEIRLTSGDGKIEFPFFLRYAEYLPLDLPLGEWMLSYRFFDEDKLSTNVVVRADTPVGVEFSAVNEPPLSIHHGAVPGLEECGLFEDTLSVPQQYCPVPTSLTQGLREVPSTASWATIYVPSFIEEFRWMKLDRLILHVVTNNPPVQVLETWLQQELPHVSNVRCVDTIDLKKNRDAKKLRSWGPGAGARMPPYMSHVPYALKDEDIQGTDVYLLIDFVKYQPVYTRGDTVTIKGLVVVYLVETKSGRNLFQDSLYISRERPVLEHHEDGALFEIDFDSLMPSIGYIWEELDSHTGGR